MRKIINTFINCWSYLINFNKWNITKASTTHCEVKRHSAFTISSTASSASKDIHNALNSLIDIGISLNSIIILCIGSDRSTGDSLGPIIGDKLKYLLPNTPLIMGTLESPVHCKNLNSTTEYIHRLFPKAFIIAIDACLGSMNSIGNIYVEDGPLYPGSALNKKLSPVGDINITAVVNSITSDSFSVLQSTRLFTVMSLAEVISEGILKFIVSRETYQNNDE